eukprot:1546116-Rhodomonas_salina.1
MPLRSALTWEQDGRVMRQFLEGGLKGMAAGTRKNALVLLDKVMGHSRLGRGMQLRESAAVGASASGGDAGNEGDCEGMSRREMGRGTDAEDRMLSMVKRLVCSAEVVLWPGGGASVGRKWSLLCVLTASVRGLMARRHVTGAEVVTVEAMRLAVGCLWHTYDCVRLSARALLNQIVLLPGCFPGFETSARVQELLGIAQKMVMSLRSRESDGGAHLMCVLYGKYVRQMGWSLEPFSHTQPEVADPDGEDTSNERVSRNFVRALAKEIKKKAQIASKDWVQASRG